MILKPRMKACRQKISVVLCESFVSLWWKSPGIIFTTETQRRTEFAQRHSLEDRLLSFIILLLILSLALPTATSFAQDQRELEAEKIKSNKLKGEHPLVEL